MEHQNHEKETDIQMKFKKIIAALAAGALLLQGCGTAAASTQGREQTAITESKAAADAGTSSVATGAETAVATTTSPASKAAETGAANSTEGAILQNVADDAAGMESTTAGTNAAAGSQTLSAAEDQPEGAASNADAAGKSRKAKKGKTPSNTTETSREPIAASDLKIGLILSGDEYDPYDIQFLNGIHKMQEQLGLTDDQIMIETKAVEEDESAYDTAIDMIDAGCQLIFSDSMRHETYMQQAADDEAAVEFCQAAGFRARSEGPANFHNFYANVYEGGYLSGIAMGMKLEETTAAPESTQVGILAPMKVGFVADLPYEEARPLMISHAASFLLGMRSVCPEAELEVRFASGWGDVPGEWQAATDLLNDGCVGLAEHTDTNTVASVAENRGVPYVGFEEEMMNTAPDVALTSVITDWSPYFIYAAQCMIDGAPIDTDWSGSYSDGAVALTPINERAAAPGTAEKIAQAAASIADGSLHVFDSATFAVRGRSLEDIVAEGGTYEYLADYVAGGYFHEQEVEEHSSFPAFEIPIDGLTIVENAQ